ncbi:hypothetical protein MMC12_000580 [Toensbergia leucococca]|nr:hypothetical protein [Toensbergia leucococca]
MVGTITHFPPFKPSSLRIPSGPLSPASPLTPEPNTPLSQFLPSPDSMEISPISDTVPLSPLPWIWTCHVCHSRYPLGATRRCLHDGHYFCAGSSNDRKLKKAKRQIPCASEFDYTGWKAWGEWRRASNWQRPSFNHSAKHCGHGCDFPSQCRYNASRSVQNTRFEDFIPQSSISTEAPSPTSPPPSVQKQKQKRPGLYLDKIVKAAEKRTVQLSNVKLSTFLSPVVEEEDEEEDDDDPTIYSPTPPGLTFPTLDFPSFKASMDSIHALPTTDQDFSIAPLRIVDAFAADNDGAMDIDSAIDEMILASRGAMQVVGGDRMFELGLDRGVEAIQLGGQRSPTSPRRNAVDWGGGSIGVALSTDEEFDVRMYE